MNFNYAIGKQMVIMDPRLCISDGGAGTNVRPLAPPFCYNSWVVNPSTDKVEHILDHAAAVADGAGKLDALHIMAHGTPGLMQIGVDNMTMKNVEHWSKLENVNYTIGKQMVIMDQRLCYSDGPVGTGANIRPMAAPFCYNSWVVNPTADTLEHILDHAAKVAAGVGKLDVIPRTDSRNPYSPSTLNLGSYIFSQN